MALEVNIYDKNEPYNNTLKYEKLKHTSLYLNENELI